MTVIQRWRTGGSILTVDAVVMEPDVTAPSVFFIYPENNQRINGRVTVRAAVNDTSGVASVVFSINGGVINEDGAAPYSATFNGADYSAGEMILSVGATDTAKNTTRTSIRVINEAAD